MPPVSEVIVARTIAEIRGTGFQNLGLVPTMGALHEGHAMLIRRARAENDFVVVTIFVNPAQFNRSEDFQHYPRTFEEDCKICEELGVDAIFAPDTDEMYPGEPLTSVEVAGLSIRLEGEFRPGHFRGVSTVVAKLFNIIRADRAYFGEKDAQQLAIIQKMVADLNIPVEIVPVPTVREPDGLAMSSRNRRLTPEHRRIAPVFYKALSAAETAIRSGSADISSAREMLAAIPEIRVEYLEVVDPATFLSITQIGGAARVVGAIWLGDVRLIDNVLVEK